MRRNKPTGSDLKILFEDNHLLVVNKPAGLLTQGDRTGDRSLLDYVADYLKIRYQKPGNAFVGLVHRIDRPVSGVVLLAKTSKALTRMNKAFAEGRVTKCYYALTNQAPAQESAVLVNWLKKDPVKNRTKVFHIETKGAKRAELRYSMKTFHGSKHMLEVYPLTGRPHQIRAQLGAIGCPIIGDVKYGYRGKPSHEIGLHARSLQFEHPVKRESLDVVAPLPDGSQWRPFQPI